MAEPRPARAAYRLEETPDGLRVAIPAPGEELTRWALGAAAALWLVVVSCFLDDLARAWPRLKAGDFRSFGGFFLLAALVYAKTGVRALTRWTWSVYGREDLLLGAETLSVTRSVAGSRRVEKFRVSDVRGLRVAAVPHLLDGVWPSSDGRARPARSAAVFDRAGTSIFFAAGLAPDQLEILVRHLISRCPALGA